MNSNQMVMIGGKILHFGTMAVNRLELEPVDKIPNLKCLETSPSWGKNPGPIYMGQLHYGQQANMVIRQACFLVEKQGYLVEQMQVCVIWFAMDLPVWSI